VEHILRDKFELEKAKEKVKRVWESAWKVTMNNLNGVEKNLPNLAEGIGEGVGRRRG